jgi:hypothetical protein
VQMPYVYVDHPRLPRGLFSPIGDSVIKPRLYEFYAAATHFRPIMTLRPEMALQQNKPVIELLTYARLGVFALFDGNPFSERYLPGSSKKAQSIGQYIDAHFIKMTGEPWDGALIESKLQGLQSRVKSFETLLEQELQELPVFCCEDEALGNLSVNKLLIGAHNGYPREVREHLPPQCPAEIDEAGKCLVFERATAAGFHILRAVELALIAYLNAIPGFTMPPLNRQNWGEYIAQLKKNSADKGLVDHIQNLKDNHRNPLMHPQDTLTMPEAVSLFGVCQGSIETIISDGMTRGLFQ